MEDPPATAEPPPPDSDSFAHGNGYADDASLPLRIDSESERLVQRMTHGTPLSPVLEVPTDAQHQHQQQQQQQETEENEEAEEKEKVKSKAKEEEEAKVKSKVKEEEEEDEIEEEEEEQLPSSGASTPCSGSRTSLGPRSSPAPPPPAAHRRCVSDCAAAAPHVRLETASPDGSPPHRRKQALTPPLASTPSSTGPAQRPPAPVNGMVSLLEPSLLLSSVYAANGASPSPSTAAGRFLAPNSSFSSLSSLVSVSTDFSVGEVDGSSVRSLEAGDMAVAGGIGYTRSSASLDRGVSEDSGVVLGGAGEDGSGRGGGRKANRLTGFINSALVKFAASPGKPGHSGKANGVTTTRYAGGGPSSTTALILHDRPDGLPAKDPKESKRHAQEYFRLVERIKKGESEQQRRAEDEEQRRFHREMRIRNNLDAWRSEVLPHWHPRLLRADRHGRNLLWDGVPGPLRDKAWPLMVGNELGITRDLYEQCVRRLRAIRPEAAPADGSNPDATRPAPGGPSREQQSLNLICSDIVRTFPKLSFFQVDGPQHRDMIEVLGAYAFGYKPEVGYCQGMSFLAAVLLLNLPSPYEAFVCLANLLNRPVLHSLYCGDLGEKFNAYRAVFDHYMARVLPELQLHFDRIGLDSRIYLLSWLLTLFSSTLPLECSFRVWDLYLVDGDPFLFRAALGLLRCLQPFLLKQCYDLTAEFLTKMIPDDTLCPTKLFQSIRSVAVDSDEFYGMLDEAQRDDSVLL